MLLAQFLEPELTVLQTVILTIWLFAMGACVGSFLNVVAYRTPAGLSIAHPPSHCPHCQLLIRGRDNIPIFSWIALRGKCRQCAAPISSRYLAVEVLAGITFALLALFEATTDGSNLPKADEPYSSFAPKLWLLYANHVVLLSTLGCIGLIDFDRQLVPRQLGIPCALAAGITMAMISNFHPLESGMVFDLGWRLNNLTTATLGAATGGLLGWAVEPLIRQACSTKVHQGGWILAATLCGWVLGWQATVVLLLLTTLVLLIVTCLRVLTKASLTITSDQPPTTFWRRCFPSPGLPPSCWLFFITPGVIITWRCWWNWWRELFLS